MVGWDPIYCMLFVFGYVTFSKNSSFQEQMLQCKENALQVIQRKLVQVLTPATTIEGNMGPDAVHLLAIKEVSIAAF